ncbi:MAG: hypothetical protein A2817_03385 [Candidatus Yanofskybacteria bacterium RIFCSPHIGHO2_01_FULL_39_8b]|uniref:Acylneuraminate cytidylyltransferase n=1 Tax=Candidatus Yanofskybacteria bacterium RIFCSPHIGHO2_01_FULL_39_8b TaxID=1802659 RepID=A0A1F8EF09_9BACT|nr:MAG: hypothetical protein A2817_03385 [Candidatus Yanofskybacteria bacterium RIFCSPHIGHO2_01_FULL_39_8b]
MLAYIPARGGSKRIPGKNFKKFVNKPLIAHAVEQALSWPHTDRLIVDTDSPKIAKIAKKYGAEVPFLRPAELAQDKSMAIDTILYTLNRLEKEQNYKPTHLLMLQATSPLRELKDIDACWKMMKETDATTVLTVCSTHPRLYHMNDKNDIILVNGHEGMSTNMQAWSPAYLLNGCFVYIIDIATLKKERRVITTKTKAVVCPKWRSIDLDTPEEWVMAEILYRNKKKLEKEIKSI